MLRLFFLYLHLWNQLSAFSVPMTSLAFPHPPQSHDELALSRPAPSHHPTTVHYVEADGIKFFYRAAGAVDAPVLLLLHGYPSSSIQYTHLLAGLSDKYRLVAPDMPGFGFTEVPDERKYEYTFANLAKSVEAFVDAVGLDKFGIYLFDYGAPVGMRLATARPDSISYLISQNGNIFDQGLGPNWPKLYPLWADPSAENKAKLRYRLTPDAVKTQYLTGETNASAIPPEAYTLDAALLARPGQEDIQLGLVADYRHNVELYSEWQEWLRERQVPVLAVWGKNDIIFVPAGAEAFKEVVPTAEVVLVDGGHFPLENHSDEIVGHIRRFLVEHNI